MEGSIVKDALKFLLELHGALRGRNHQGLDHGQRELSPTSVSHSLPPRVAAWLEYGSQRTWTGHGGEEGSIGRVGGTLERFLAQIQQPLNISEPYQFGHHVHHGSSLCQKGSLQDTCTYSSWPFQNPGYAPYFHFTTTSLGKLGHRPKTESNQKANLKSTIFL